MTNYLLMFITIFATVNASYAQWVRQTNGLPHEWGVAEAIDACDQNCAVISVGTSLYQTTDGGDLWQQLAWPYETVIDVEVTDASHILACTIDGRIMTSEDSGQSWTIRFDDSSQTRFMNYIEMFDSNHGVAMGDAPAADKPALFLQTTDGGTTWTSMNETMLLGFASTSIWHKVDFVDLNTGYFHFGADPMQLVRTLDGGQTWSQVTYVGRADLLTFCDRNLGLTFSNSHALQRTTDGGVSWETFHPATAGLGGDIEFISGQPAKVWLSDGYYLFFSADTGRTWEKIVVRENPDDLWLRDIVFVDEQHGWIVGDDGYVYHTSNGGLITNVAENADVVPGDFYLAQNYPNPFNPVTTIDYEVPKAGHVSIEVFNILGERIATLLDERKEPGSYSVSWDGTTGAGRKVASGVYVYRLRAGEVVQSRKMLLLQ